MVITVLWNIGSRNADRPRKGWKDQRLDKNWWNRLYKPEIELVQDENPLSEKLFAMLNIRGTTMNLIFWKLEVMTTAFPYYGNLLQPSNLYCDAVYRNIKVNKTRVTYNINTFK